MENEVRPRAASGIAWMAFLVAVIALVIAWMAYNRTGTDLENRIAEQVQNATDSAENAIDNGPDGVDDGAR